MKDLREIIAKNICALRTEANMTQLGLAELLNYSDKAVSKWERGEAIPDVIVLKRIADHFGVTVDYLLEEKHSDSPINARTLRRLKNRNHLIISLAAYVCVWLVATVAFALLTGAESVLPAWLVFIYAIPLSFTVALVFNCIWGRRSLNALPTAAVLWGVILSAYLTLKHIAGLDAWLLFVIGAPLQIILLFMPGISFFRFTFGPDRRSER